MALGCIVSLTPWAFAMQHPGFPAHWPSFAEVEQDLEEETISPALGEHLWQTLLLAQQHSVTIRSRWTERTRSMLDARPGWNLDTRLRIALAGAEQGLETSAWALDSLDYLLERARGGGMHLEEGLALLELGRWHLRMDNTPAAGRYFHGAGEAFRRANEGAWLAVALDYLVEVYLQSDLSALAEETLIDYQQAAEWVGHPAVRAAGHLKEAEFYLYQGRINEALGKAEVAVQLLQGSAHHRMLVSILLLKGQAHLEAGELFNARAHLDGAAWTAREQGILQELPDLLGLQAHVRIRLGSLDGAEDLATEAIALAEELGLEERIPPIHLTMARAALLAGETEIAARHLKAAGQGLVEHPSKRVSMDVYQAWAEVHSQAKNFEAAMLAYKRAAELFPLIEAEREALRRMELVRMLERATEAARAGSARHIEDLEFIIENQQARLGNLVIIGLVLAGMMLILAIHRHQAQREGHRLMQVALEHARRSEQRESLALQAKNEFLASVTHEIRTPLNGIIGMSSLLDEMNLGSEQREFVKTIYECGQNLLFMIDDILDLARIEAGRFFPTAIVFDSRATLERVCTAFVARAAAKGLAFEWDLHDRLPIQVEGDERRFEQILRNLLDNAFKFTVKGRVYVRAQAEGGDASSVGLRVDVIDTGIGIPESRRNDVFDAFTKVDDSNTRAFGGSGLGLTISRCLAEVMNGGLTFSSQPGEGSCFTLRVRFKRPGHWEAGGGSGTSLELLSSGTSVFPGIHVLVFDPGQAVMENVIQRLQEQEFTVEKVTSSQALRDCLAQRPPHLALIHLDEDDTPIRSIVAASVRSPGDHRMPFFVAVVDQENYQRQHEIYGHGFDEILDQRALLGSLPTVFLKSGLFQERIS